MDKEPHRREPPEYAPPGQEYAQPGHECADPGWEQQPEEPTGNHYTAPRQEKHRHEREALLRTLLLGAVTVTVAAAAVTNTGLQWKDTGAEQIQTTPIPTATSTPTAEPTPEPTAEPTATPAPTRTPQPEWTAPPPLNGISINPPDPAVVYLYDTGSREPGVRWYELRILFPYDTVVYDPEYGTGYDTSLEPYDYLGEEHYVDSDYFSDWLSTYPYGRNPVPENADDPEMVEEYTPYRNTAMIIGYDEDHLGGVEFSKSPEIFYLDSNALSDAGYDPFGSWNSFYATITYTVDPEALSDGDTAVIMMHYPAGDHYEERTYRYNLASLPIITQEQFYEASFLRSGDPEPVLAQ